MIDFIKRKKLEKKEIFLRSGVNFRNTNFEGKNKVGRRSDVTESKIGLATYIGLSLIHI